MSISAAARAMTEGAQAAQRARIDVAVSQFGTNVLAAITPHVQHVTAGCVTQLLDAARAGRFCGKVGEASSFAGTSQWPLGSPVALVRDSLGNRVDLEVNISSDGRVTDANCRVDLAFVIPAELQQRGDDLVRSLRSAFEARGWEPEHLRISLDTKTGQGVIEMLGADLLGRSAASVL